MLILLLIILLIISILMHQEMSILLSITNSLSIHFFLYLSSFPSVFTISQYSVFDYISAYAPRNWTLSGSSDLQTWTLLDRRDEPPVDHIFRKYDYSMNKENIPFAYYKYTILGILFIHVPICR